MTNLTFDSTKRDRLVEIVNELMNPNLEDMQSAEYVDKLLVEYNMLVQGFVPAALHLANCIEQWLTTPLRVEKAALRKEMIQTLNCM